MGGNSSSGAGAAAPTREARTAERSNSLGVEWALAFGAIGLCGLGWLALDRIQQTQADVVRELKLETQRVELAVRELEQVEEEVRVERELQSQQIDQRIAALDERLGAARDVFQQAGAQGLQALAPRLDELQRTMALASAAGHDRDLQLGRMSDIQEQVRTDLGLVAQSMLDVLRAPAEATAPVEGQAKFGDVPGSDLGDSPTWLPVTAALRSRDSSERWNAVEALGETRDPRAADYVVEALGDQDLFVRMAAARALGELNNLDSVPALIGALEDAEPSVREVAVLALRTITGQEFDFDAGADTSRRAKRVEDWRDWWERTNRSS